MIMNAAVHALALGLREALVIWFVLIALAVLACALVAAPSWYGRLRHLRRNVLAHHDRARRPRTTHPTDRRYDDALRYAEEVTVAANRAADAAERWRSEWLAVQSARDAAWHAYEVAHEAACRAYRAAAFPMPECAPTPDERAARERYLHRAVWEAYRRGDLSLQQLCDALAHRAGWDADRHPFEQELVLRRAGLERKLHAYQTVAAMERTAWRASDLAQSATCSLRAEARAASVRARLATLAA
jgi:hypothetical protein